jgi:hypothetical protein
MRQVQGRVAIVCGDVEKAALIVTNCRKRPLQACYTLLWKLLMCAMIQQPIKRHHWWVVLLAFAHFCVEWDTMLHMGRLFCHSRLAQKRAVNIGRPLSHTPSIFAGPEKTQSAPIRSATGPQRPQRSESTVDVRERCGKCSQ